MRLKLSSRRGLLGLSVATLFGLGVVAESGIVADESAAANPKGCTHKGRRCACPPKTRTDKRTGLTWVKIKGGSFRPKAKPDLPMLGFGRGVRLKTFEIARTEVTVAQYRRCVIARSCTKPRVSSRLLKRFRTLFNWGTSGRDNHPVNFVSWHQAKQYAKWAKGRLPTEYQWEYAARSRGRNWKYPWGNTKASCKRAVLNQGKAGCGKGTTWPVCSKPRGNSRQGLCDMAGNLTEWTANYRAKSPSARPGPSFPATAATRGGSWSATPGGVVSTFRWKAHPAGHYSNVGFRIVR